MRGGVKNTMAKPSATLKKEPFSCMPQMRTSMRQACSWHLNSLRAHTPNIIKLYYSSLMFTYTRLKSQILKPEGHAVVDAVEGHVDRS